jgi:hypothetical protein
MGLSIGAPLLLAWITAFLTQPDATVVAFLPTNTVVTVTVTPPSSVLLLARPRSKWDDLVDDDDDDDGGDSSPAAIESTIPVPPDMTYVERNVRRCHENFLNLRNIGGKDVCKDVWAKSPHAEEEIWYVGKIAKISDVSTEDAIARMWNLIETHATNLRPIELYPHRGRLELWTAPGDSELDVAYNRPAVVFQKMEKYEIKNLKNNLIGFQGEVYQEGEEGFRSWRTKEGGPARPEINPGGETRPPTEEEMEQLRKEMERDNISVQDVYKESQKRKN